MRFMENLFHNNVIYGIEEDDRIASSCCSTASMHSSSPRLESWAQESHWRDPRCEYCNGVFAKDATKCQNCGAPR